MLIPSQTFTLIGIELLLLGLIAWIIITSLDVNILRTRKAQYRLPYMVNVTLSQIASLPSIIAGIIVLTRGTGGLFWLVPAIIFSFIEAILDAWVLLVEINR